jgi:hypothetical protein
MPIQTSYNHVTKIHLQDIKQSLRRCFLDASSRRRRLGLRLPMSLAKCCCHHQRKYQGRVGIDLELTTSALSIQ